MSELSQNFMIQAFNAMAAGWDRRTAGASNDLSARLLSRGPPLSSESVILDFGSGSGTLIEEVQRYFSPASKTANKDTKVKVIAVDAAEEMMNLVKAKAQKAKATDAWPNISTLETHVVLAEELNEAIIPSNTVTHAYSNFALYFFMDPVKVCQNIQRVLAPGGTVFFTIRKEEDVIPIIRKTEKRLNPENENFQLQLNTDREKSAYLKDILERGGLRNVKVETEECFMRAPNLKEMALIIADTWENQFRPGGWKNADEKEKWVEVFGEELVKDSHFVDYGEKGVGIRMDINVARGTK